MSTSTTLGERIKMLRGSASQRQFSLSLGIPQTTLANYETNKSELSFSMIHTFTRKLGINTDWLIFGEGPQWVSSEPASAGTVVNAQTPETPCMSGETVANGSSNPGKECEQLEQIEMLRSELVLERRERRELAAENRQLNRDKAALLQELIELKVQLARLEMSQKSRGEQGEGSC